LHTLLVFTNRGNYCFVPIHKLEEFKWKDLGKHISYLIKLNNDEKIIATVLVKDFKSPQYVMMASRDGAIKKVAIADFEVSRFSRPMKCMNLKADDEMVSVQLSSGHDGVILASKAGYAALYSEEEISVVGIKAGGVKGIRLTHDSLAFMRVFNPANPQALVIFTNPVGIKRIHVSDIPACKRANKGNLIFKSPKSRQITLYDGYIMDTYDTLTLYGESGSIEVCAKDFNFTGLINRPGGIKSFEDKSIDFIYDPRLLIADGKVEEEGSFKEFFQVEKEKTLFEEETPIKKKEENKFKPISFDDLFENDDF
jgi:topoisomerase-4 subunit A